MIYKFTRLSEISGGDYRDSMRRMHRNNAVKSIYSIEIHCLYYTAYSIAGYIVFLRIICKFRGYYTQPPLFPSTHTIHIYIILDQNDILITNWVKMTHYDIVSGYKKTGLLEPVQGVMYHYYDLFHSPIENFSVVTFCHVTGNFDASGIV